MKRLVKRIAASAGFEIKRQSRNKEVTSLVSLAPAGGTIGNVLLSYRSGEFLLGDSESIPNDHIAYWESYQIAHAFVRRGYCVDSIDWLDEQFVPKKTYAFLIDIYSNLERIAPLINNDCVKILHIVRAHWLFHNKAEYERLYSLQRRKGISLKPKRQMAVSNSIEQADYATILGDGFARSTYEYAQIPIYSIPNPTIETYPWPDHKDFSACNRNFLWLGSIGFVHKGLDRLLEAFSDLPDYNLTICGPMTKEKDFQKIYEKELYGMSNIRTYGFVDVASSEFLNITDSCIALLFPSCSEGQSGAVVNCMHAGLLPVVSKQAGFDVRGFGFELETCSIEEIRDIVQSISRLPSDRLKEMAKLTWEYARANHTKNAFIARYDEAIDEIINDAMAKKKRCD